MTGPKLLVGTRKGLLQYHQSGKSWKLVSESFAGAPVPFAIRDSRTGVMWASIDHGHWGSKLHRSRDEGRSWEEVEAPKYPEGSIIREGTPATTKYIWVIAPGGHDQPQRLYLGTEPGGLFISDDGGDSFELNMALWEHPSRPTQWFGGGRDEAGIHSVIVDPRDSRRILVGISCAGIFESTDDGASWSPRNKGLRADFLPDPTVEVGHDPHYVTFAPSNPDVLWQQNHMGIFRSDDGSASWAEVSEPDGPAAFGFAVAVDQHNAERAWVVPAQSDDRRTAFEKKLVVCRTDDGGGTWKAFGRGLPDRECFDLAFRHALDVQDDLVAFGTTNGNMFVSSDAGETWQVVSNYLPPIYSVRFVR